jgi:putative MATE family efflux protein
MPADTGSVREARVTLLTEGGLLHGLLHLAGPMFVSSVLQNAQTLIDLFWVGRLGSSAVAGVAVAGTILMLLFPMVLGLTIGTTAIVSRRVGGRAFDSARLAASQSLLLAMLVGVVAGVAGLFSAPGLCRLLGTPADAMKPATDYLRVLFPGSVTTFVLFSANSILQAAGHTMIPMTSLLAANAINIVLAPVLIFGWLGMPALGVTGAGLATVLSQVVACWIVLHALHRDLAGFHVPLARIRWHRGQALEILRIGLPGTGQMLSRSLMAMVLMAIVAKLGTAVVAGYGIGLRYHVIVLMPAFVFGNAAGTMVGQNLGAGRPHRARAVAWLAAGIEVAIMLVAAVLMMVFAEPLIRVFDASPSVVAVGASYLRTVSFFYAFVGLAIVLGRSIEGAGDTVPTMIFTIVALWGIQVPLAEWLSRVAVPAYMGVWWAIAAAFTVNALLVLGWFVSGRWLRRRV